MVFHFGYNAMINPNGFVATFSGMTAGTPSAWALTWWGWIGVQIFFVVSGLVISHSVFVPGVTGAKFFRSRLLRLFPVLIIASCFAFLVEVFVFGRSFGETSGLLIKTLLFWPLPPWIMGQFWTLGIEVSFYAVLLGLIVWKRTDHLVSMAKVLIALSTLYWVARFALDGADPIGMGRITQLVLAQHGQFFAIGILLAEWQRSGRHRNLLWGLLAIPACLFQIWYSSTWEADNPEISAYWFTVFLIFFGMVLLAAVSLRFNAVAHAKLPKSTGRWMRLAGITTYPLYLLHFHVGVPILGAAIAAGVPIALSIFLSCVASTAMAVWVATKLEPPLRKGMGVAYDAVSAVVVRRFKLGRFEV